MGCGLVGVGFRWGAGWSALVVLGSVGFGIGVVVFRCRCWWWTGGGGGGRGRRGGEGSLRSGSCRFEYSRREAGLCPSRGTRVSGITSSTVSLSAIHRTS